MRSVEEYVEMYRSVVQEAVPQEQVLAVGIMSPPGTMKSMLVGQGSGLAASIMRRAGKKASGGFPTNFLMGVTATRLVTFSYKPRGNRIKLVAPLTDWPRRHVRVELGKTGMSQRMRFTFSDGQSIEMDALRSVGQFDRMNDQFFSALGLSRYATA